MPPWRAPVGKELGSRRPPAMSPGSTRSSARSAGPRREEISWGRPARPPRSAAWAGDRGAAAARTADGQQWVKHPAGNFGWILTGNETSRDTAMQFDSKEN